MTNILGYIDEEDYGDPSYRIMGCNLYKTCDACPEQYDVFKDGKQIGYLRLRHGRFYAAYPDVGGVEVYDALPRGEGEFCDNERGFYLTAACKALLEEHRNTVLNSPAKQVIIIILK